MAGFTEQRHCIRESCRIPLIFAFHRSHTYYDATVMNISKDGMYLETRKRLRAGSGIRIRLEGTDATVCEEKRFLEMDNATVLWCTGVEKGDGRFFGAGISFNLSDIVASEEEGAGIEYHCDMCGKKMNAGEFQKIQGRVCLCAICHEYLSTFPEALRKRCIERFLTVNSR